MAIGRARAALWVGLLACPAAPACDATLDPVGALAESDAGLTSADAGSSDARANDAELMPGLVGLWTLDSDPSDAVGSNDGMLIGAASFTTDAQRGKVLLCDGVEAAVQISNTLGTSFTFAAWLWSDTPSSVGSSAIEGDPLIWSNDPMGIDDFALAVLNDRLSYINYNEKSTGTALVTDAKWHHVAASRRDGERVALYVDGQVDGDGNSGTGVVSANPNVYFCGFPGGRHFKGLLDDVRLFDRVLSTAEVAALFAGTR